MPRTSSRASRLPKQVGRPRRSEQALLDAAAAVFVESGVDAPVREIAAKAGVGMGTIYRHFPTRPELVVAVYRHQVEACADAGPQDARGECNARGGFAGMGGFVRGVPGNQAWARRCTARRQRRVRRSAYLLRRPPRFRYVTPSSRQRSSPLALLRGSMRTTCSKALGTFVSVLGPMTGTRPRSLYSYSSRGVLAREVR